jgi:hypothetical protein
MDEKRKKEELLAELESIKDLLDSDPLSDNTFFDPRAQRPAPDRDLTAQALTSSQEIPTLNEMVLENEPFNDEHIDISSTAANKVLPGQQSLFEQEKLKRKKTDAELEALDNKLTNTATVDREEDGQQAIYSYLDSFQDSSLDGSLDSPPDNSLDRPLGNSLGNSFGNSFGNSSGNSSGNPSGNSSGNPSGNSSGNSVDSTTENPFLPKHIRERLTKPSDLKDILAGNANKRFLLPPIVKATVDNDSIVQRRFFSSNSFLNTIRPDSSNTQSLESALNKTSLYKNSSPVRPGSEVKAEPELAQPRSRPDAKIDLLVDELIAQYLPEIEAKLRFQLKQALMQSPPKK